MQAMVNNSGARDNLEDYTTIDGLFHGGGFYLLGVQVLLNDIYHTPLDTTH